MTSILFYMRSCHNCISHISDKQKIGRTFNFEIFLAPDCWYPAYFADTYCDDDNNNVECNYDGGDCCNNDKDGWNNFCSACDCKDPSGKEPIHVIWF